MGQLILEIPQDVNRTFRIESEKKAADILELLEEKDERQSKFERLVASGAIELPKYKRTKKISDDVLGIWADREESAQGKFSGIIPPRRKSLKEDGEKVLGIWADREESAQEIARRIRDRNNGKDE